MRHCQICRKRQAIQEVSFEQSLMFLCSICFARLEGDQAAYADHYHDPWEEDEQSFPNSMFFPEESLRE